MTSMQTVTRSLTFACGEEELVGIVHEPAAQAKNVGVVIVVGGPQYRVGSHRQFVLTARSLAAAGHAVLRFDMRGMGDSTGQPQGFLASDDDIEAAVDALMRAIPSVQSVCLYGLCDGASAASLYGQRDPRVTAIVLVNPWVRTEAGEAQTILRHYYWQRVRQPEFWRKLLSSRFGWRNSVKSLLRNAARAGQSSGADGPGGPSGGDYVEKMAEAMRRFRGRTLILLSDDDLTAKEFDTVCSARGSWKQVLGRPDVKVERIPEADHTFSSSSALRLADNIVLTWLTSP